MTGLRGTVEGWLAPRSSLGLVLGAVLLSGGFVMLFDILRKTVFLGATWNYGYPEWNFVYAVPVMILLVAAMAGAALGIGAFLELDDDRFVVALVALIALVSALSFFALPEKSHRRALTPQSGLFYAATVFVERGPLEFVASYHSLGTLVGTDPGIQSLAGGPAPEGTYADDFAAAIESARYLPWRGELAAYAAEIKVQKHGPMAAVAVVPFLYLFGPTPAAAAFGSYAVTGFLPLIGYATFRGYFDERYARIGALFVLFTPTYVINQRSGPIAYDAIAAVFIALSVYAFVAWAREDRSRNLALAGVLFSLGALTKISVLPLLLGYFVAFVLLSETAVEVAKRTAGFGLAALVVPVALIPLGYNFLMQYAFTIFKMFATSGQKIEYGSPLLSQLAAIYNARWFGPPLLLLVAIFAVYALAHRREMLETRRYALGASFVLPMLPYVALIGMTISRHMLPLLTAVVFVGLFGLEVVGRETDDRNLLRLVQASLLVTAGVTLVNL